MNGRLNRSIAAGALLGAVSSGLVLLSLGSPVQERASWHGIAKLVPQGDPVPLPDFASFAAIADRPLFAVSRRKAIPIMAKPVTIQPPSTPTVAPPFAPADRLLATVIGSTRSVAVLHLLSGGTWVVAKGELIKGWLLSEVSADSIALTLQATRKSLTFQTHQSGSSTTYSRTALEPNTNLLRRR